MGLILVHVGRALAVLLLVLNGHLRQPNKIQIDATLGILWLGSIAAGFIVFGWKVAITSLVLSLFCGLLSKPVASLMARRILGHWTTFRPPWVVSAGNLSEEALRAHHRPDGISNRRLRWLGRVAAAKQVRGDKDAL
jgi:hypothetical protein